MLNPNSLARIVSEITASTEISELTQTDGHGVTYFPTKLIFTYFSTNSVYPFTPQVTGIMPTNRKDKIIQGRTI